VTFIDPPTLPPLRRSIGGTAPVTARNGDVRWRGIRAAWKRERERKIKRASALTLRVNLAVLDNSGLILAFQGIEIK